MDKNQILDTLNTASSRESKKDIVDGLLEALLAAKQRGVTWPELAAILRRGGLDITSELLRYYVRNLVADRTTPVSAVKKPTATLGNVLRLPHPEAGRSRPGGAAEVERSSSGVGPEVERSRAGGGAEAEPQPGAAKALPADRAELEALVAAARGGLVDGKWRPGRKLTLAETVRVRQAGISLEPESHELEPFATSDASFFKPKPSLPTDVPLADSPSGHQPDLPPSD